MRLLDVCLLTRDIHGLYVQTCCTSKPAPIPINIISKGLISVISARTNIAIEVRCLPWSGHMFRARINRYGDRATILYSSGLNTCWGRFCICKEAYHLLSDDIRTYSADPVSLVNGLINDIPSFNTDDDIEAEWMAVYGAMALLIPESSHELLYELEKDGKSHFEIAVKFCVPEKIISLRLSPQVRQMFDDIHKDMR